MIIVHGNEHSQLQVVRWPIAFAVRLVIISVFPKAARDDSSLSKELVLGSIFQLKRKF